MMYKKLSNNNVKKNISDTENKFRHKETSQLGIKKCSCNMFQGMQLYIYNAYKARNIPRHIYMEERKGEEERGGGIREFYI